jgi:hypothetical protein
LLSKRVICCEFLPVTSYGFPLKGKPPSQALKGQPRSNGQFFIDEALLRETSVTDFSGYAVDPSQPLV